MIDVLIYAGLCLIIFFTGYGIWAYFRPEEYEWRKNIAARRHWEKMLEDK